LEGELDEVIVLADIDGMIEEDDEQIRVYVDEFLSGEGEVDVLLGLLGLNVD
jgi:hypothetical protein